MGSKWTFEVWDNVSYSEGSSAYCPEYVYTFTYVTIIVLWVLVALSLTCGLLAKFCNCFYDILCCRPCKGNSNQAV